MSTRYTLAPWTADPDVGHEGVRGVGNRLVADCAIFGTGDKQFNQEENQANARLIAAAPELLDMCKKMLDVCVRVDDGEPVNMFWVINDLQEVIAEAEGLA